MKSIKGRLFIGLGLLTLLGVLHAQLDYQTAQPVQVIGIDQPAQPDSVVAVTADAYGLEPAGSDTLPVTGGTFWIVGTNGVIPPYPGLPAGFQNCPAWTIADGIYLVDATGGVVPSSDWQASGAMTAMSVSTEQATADVNALGNSVANLIEQIQGAQYVRDMAASLGMESEFSLDQNNFAPMAMQMVSDPDGLWLEITNYANDFSYYNLHNATNLVYEILTKTNLLDPSWTIETELWPTTNQTSVLPFVLANYGRPILFVRARDWTGVTHGGNTVPDWWLWKYFGTTELSDTNQDCLENTLVNDYTNGISPNPITANALSVATCKNTPVAITLSGYDQCGDDPATFLYALVSIPTNGYLTGVPPNLTYTPASPTFTGMDSFTYKVGNAWGGDAATNTVTIAVGDADVTANGQSPMTGTNQSLNITLSASSPLGCTNSFIYTMITSPAHGTNSGSGASRIYTPAHNYEGMDSFTFAASDGAWTNSPATVTVFVVAGPTNLTAQCRFGQIVLSWSLDDAVQVMETEGLNLQDFRVYRSTTHGGPYTLIDTTANATVNNYVDMSVATNTTYYYVTTFRYQDPYTGITYESPYSGEAAISPCGLPSPLRPGFNQNILAANDDDCLGGGNGDNGNYLTNLLATIGFPINFFGTTYTNLYVNNNGNVTFGDLLSTYTPTPLINLVTSDANTITNIIAPFWADVDTRAALSSLVTYGTNTVTVTNIGVIHTNAAFGANWIDVGYFIANDNKLNAFQLVLINRPDRASGDYDVEFNYAQIQWETGDASDGNDGLGGSSARAGYASASGLTFELNGSGTNGAFLDANLVTGLIHTNYNSGGLLG
jgi:Nidogen-like/Bacterial Ig domain